MICDNQLSDKLLKTIENLERSIEENEEIVRSLTRQEPNNREIKSRQDVIKYEKEQLKQLKGKLGMNDSMQQLALMGITQDDENWITVKGAHVKIGEGESKGSAVKKFIKKKGGDPAGATSEEPKEFNNKVEFIPPDDGDKGWYEKVKKEFKENGVKQTLKDFPDRIRFIKNPSKELQEFAIKNGADFRFIKDPIPEDLVIKRIRNYPDDFGEIKNPSEKLINRAVINNPATISFVENPSEELQLKAIKRAPWVIKSIKNPTERVKKMAKLLLENWGNSTERERLLNDSINQLAMVGITQDAGKDQAYWDKQGEYWRDQYYYWKAIFETSPDPKARKEAKPKMEEAKRKRDFAYQQFNSFITKDADPDKEYQSFMKVYGYPKTSEEAEKLIAKAKQFGIHPDYIKGMKKGLVHAKTLNKDNDATEGGAIEQYGENKETESMPLEKEPIQAEDEKTYQNGEHVKVQVGNELVDVKVLKDLGDKVTVKGKNGAVVDIPKIYIKDSDIVKDSYEMLKLSGIV